MTCPPNHIGTTKQGAGAKRLHLAELLSPALQQHSHRCGRSCAVALTWRPAAVYYLDRATTVKVLQRCCSRACHSPHHERQLRSRACFLLSCLLMLIVTHAAIRLLAQPHLTAFYSSCILLLLCTLASIS